MFWRRNKIADENEVEKWFLFLKLLDLEDRNYRISRCTNDFVDFLVKSNFPVQKYSQLNNVIDVCFDKRDNIVELNYTIESFQTRIDILTKPLKYFVEV